MNNKKRILKIRAYNMANFSGGSDELFTLSLLSVIPAVVAQIVTRIVYVYYSTDEKTKEKAIASLSASRVFGTVFCGIAAAGSLFIFFLSVFSYFNTFWGIIVLILAAAIPIAPYFLSLTLGCRYFKKHEPCDYEKPLKVVISWFVGTVLLGELLLGVIILLFSSM